MILENPIATGNIADISKRKTLVEEYVLVVSAFGSGWINIDWSVAFNLDD